MSRLAMTHLLTTRVLLLLLLLLLPMVVVVVEVEVEVEEEMVVAAKLAQKGGLLTDRTTMRWSCLP